MSKKSTLTRRKMLQASAALLIPNSILAQQNAVPNKSKGSPTRINHDQEDIADLIQPNDISMGRFATDTNLEQVALIPRGVVYMKDMDGKAPELNLVSYLGAERITRDGLDIQESGIIDLNRALQSITMPIDYGKLAPPTDPQRMRGYVDKRGRSDDSEGIYIVFATTQKYQPTGQPEREILKFHPYPLVAAITENGTQYELKEFIPRPALNPSPLYRKAKVGRVEINSDLLDEASKNAITKYNKIAQAIANEKGLKVDPDQIFAFYKQDGIKRPYNQPEFERIVAIGRPIHPSKTMPDGSYFLSIDLRSLYEGKKNQNKEVDKN